MVLGKSSALDETSPHMTIADETVGLLQDQTPSLDLPEEAGSTAAGGSVLAIALSKRGLKFRR